MTYPCNACNRDEGSPICLGDERCQRTDGVRLARWTPPPAPVTPEYMPILGTVLLLPMRLLTEEAAQRNHGQSLARLAERGGLSLSEAASVASGMYWQPMDDARAHELLRRAATRLALQRPSSQR